MGLLLMRSMSRLRVCCSLEGGDTLPIESIPARQMLQPVFSASLHCQLAFYAMNTLRSIDEDHRVLHSDSNSLETLLIKVKTFDKQAARENIW